MKIAEKILVTIETLFLVVILSIMVVTIFHFTVFQNDLFVKAFEKFFGVTVADEPFFFEWFRNWLS